MRWPNTVGPTPTEQIEQESSESFAIHAIHAIRALLVGLNKQIIVQSYCLKLSFWMSFVKHIWMTIVCHLDDTTLFEAHCDQFDWVLSQSWAKAEPKLSYSEPNNTIMFCVFHTTHTKRVSLLDEVNQRHQWREILNLCAKCHNNCAFHYRVNWFRTSHTQTDTSRTVMWIWIEFFKT